MQTPAAMAQINPIKTTNRAVASNVIALAFVVRKSSL